METVNFNMKDAIHALEWRTRISQLRIGNV